MMTFETQPRAPGWRLRLNHITRRVGREIPHVAYPSAPCMNCGGTDATFYPAVTRADFDTSELPDDLRDKFCDRAIGACRSCGLVQEFNRYTPEEVQRFIAILKSKDRACSEEAFHTFPVPEDYIAAFNRRYFGKRLDLWGKQLSSMKLGRVLFVRPFFGASTEFVRERYGSVCDAIEISEIARRTIEARLPYVNFLPGSVHASFTGPFLNEGPYDAIFCFHTLVHCIDFHRSLAQLKAMLAPGGVVVFTHEINVKPTNPFHMLFADEGVWLSMVKRHFPHVERIDAAEDEPDPHVSRFTTRGDCPDFIASMVDRPRR